MALTESERIYMRGEKRENPNMTREELVVELNELRKDVGTAKLQGLAPLEKGRAEIEMSRDIGVKPEITSAQREAITPKTWFPRFKSARGQFAEASKEFGEDEFLAGVKEFGKGILAGVGESAEKLGDFIPRLYMNTIDAVSKGQPGTAQFGSAIEFLEATEGKNAEEMKQEFISEGLTSEEADKILVSAVEEVERILKLQPARGKGLREVGGKLSVELPAAVAGGGAARRVAGVGLTRLGAAKTVSGISRLGVGGVKAAATGAGAVEAQKIVGEERLATGGELAFGAGLGVLAEGVLGTIGATGKYIKGKFFNLDKATKDIINPKLAVPIKTQSELILRTKEQASRATKLKQVFQQAQKNIESVDELSATAKIAVKDTKTALQKLNVLRQSAGKRLGDLKKTNAKKQVSGVSKIFSDFKNEVRDNMGGRFSNGKLTSIPGRQLTTNAPDNKILRETFSRVEKLARKGATLRESDDVVIGVRNNISAIKSQLEIKGISNAERIALNTIRKLDLSVKEAGGETFKKAKEASRELIEMTNKLNIGLGKTDTTNRTFINNILKNQETLDLAKKVKEKTGIDLVESSFFSRTADSWAALRSPSELKEVGQVPVSKLAAGAKIINIILGKIKNPEALALKIVNEIPELSKNPSLLRKIATTFFNEAKAIPSSAIAGFLGGKATGE